MKNSPNSDEKNIKIIKNKIGVLIMLICNKTNDDEIFLKYDDFLKALELFDEINTRLVKIIDKSIIIRGIYVDLNDFQDVIKINYKHYDKDKK